MAITALRSTVKGAARICLPAIEYLQASICATTLFVEKWKWIWIWMGDPALAECSTIPDPEFLKLEAEGWESADLGMSTVRARHLLLHENLLDLSHLTFLHAASIGSAGVATTKMEIEDHGAYLEITRRILNDSMDGVPLGRALEITGPVDRVMVQQFFAPSFHATGSAFASAAEAGSRPGHYYGGFRVLHGITPETPTSTHYFYAFSRDFGLGNSQIGEGIATNIRTAVAEDVVASELIEPMIVANAQASEDIHSRADAGALRGRLAIERLIEREQQNRSVRSAAE